jgi:Potential Queuosine, Q, salvage protein family
VLGQDDRHPLMRLYAEALRELGRFLGDRSALDLVEQADGSAEWLATSLARGMRFFDDRGFYKRAQIVPSDLALAGLAEFADLDSLTIFADNLVPHVLRVDGVLRYDPQLAAHIDAGELLAQGRAEREIRACALHACEQLARRTGVPARLLDVRLWNRGQAPEYKAIPRHRTRSVYY